jgi:hypothetical protein
MGHFRNTGRDERAEPDRPTGTVEVVRVRESSVRSESSQAALRNRKVELTMPGGLSGLDAMYSRLNYATHYALLGVATHASAKEVRAAYFALARHYHPDLSSRHEFAPYRRKLEAVFAAAGDLKGAGRPAMRATELLSESLDAREVLLVFFEQMGMKLNAQRERDAIARLLEARAAKK